MCLRSAENFYHPILCVWFFTYFSFLLPDVLTVCTLLFLLEVCGVLYCGLNSLYRIRRLYEESGTIIWLQHAWIFGRRHLASLTASILASSGKNYHPMLFSPFIFFLCALHFVLHLPLLRSGGEYAEMENYYRELSQLRYEMTSKLLLSPRTDWHSVSATGTALLFVLFGERSSSLLSEFGPLVTFGSWWSFTCPPAITPPPLLFLPVVLRFSSGPSLAAVHSPVLREALLPRTRKRLLSLCFPACPLGPFVCSDWAVLCFHTIWCHHSLYSRPPSCFSCSRHRSVASLIHWQSVQAHLSSLRCHHEAFSRTASTRLAIFCAMPPDWFRLALAAISSLATRSVRPVAKDVFCFFRTFDLQRCMHRSARPSCLAQFFCCSCCLVVRRFLRHVHIASETCVRLPRHFQFFDFQHGVVRRNQIRP